MVKQIKCFIQGAQGVGKTTLVEELKKYNKNGFNIGISSEVARDLIKMGIKRDRETRIEDYYAYFSEHLRHFREHKETIVFLDRSVLDVIAYARICLGPNSWVERLGIEIFKLIKDEISCIFYIPIEFEAIEDGIRDTDDSNRKLFDKTIKELMNDLNLSYIILKGTINERASTVIEEISKLHKHLSCKSRLSV